MDVERYVKGSEYRREVARILARRVVEALDPLEVIEAGAELADDLLEAVLAGLRERRIIERAWRDALEHVRSFGMGTESKKEDAKLAKEAGEKALARELAEAILILETRLAETERTLERIAAEQVSQEIALASMRKPESRKALLAGVTSVVVSSSVGMVASIETAVLREFGRLTAEAVA